MSRPLPGIHTIAARPWLVDALTLQEARLLAEQATVLARKALAEGEKRMPNTSTIDRTLALLIVLGNYIGNVDKSSGVDRCEAILALRDLRSTLEAMLHWRDRGQVIDDSFWESLRAHLGANGR